MKTAILRAIAGNGSRPTPIILGNHINALGLARGLGREGLTSIVMDSSDGVAFHSRFGVWEMLPSPVSRRDEFNKALLELMQKLPHGGMLFATSDIYLEAALKIRHLLEPGLRFGMSSNPTIDLFLSKIQTLRLAKSISVEIPATVELKGKDLASAACHSPFPAILKPTITIGFREALALGRQTIVISTAEELLPLRDRLLAANLGETDFVLQDFIPGGAENLYTISTFSDESGRILAYSSGHKIRQNPPEAGTICCGRVVPTPELLFPTQRLFEATNFNAVANTEYKRDPRDGKFRLMEVNPRPGKWNSSATATGVNLPFIAYNYATTGQSPINAVTSKEEINWYVSSEYFFSLIREFGIAASILTPWRWWPEISGKKVDGLFSWNDPLPFLNQIGKFSVAAARKILSRR